MLKADDLERRSPGEAGRLALGEQSAGVVAGVHRRARRAPKRRGKREFTSSPPKRGPPIGVAFVSVAIACGGRPKQRRAPEPPPHSA